MFYTTIPIITKNYGKYLFRFLVISIAKITKKYKTPKRIGNFFSDSVN